MAIDEMKVGRAWSIKETFRRFWDYRYRGAAESFFKSWYYWATHSKLKPIVDAARTLKRHIVGILAYLKHHITNAATEGLNSKIQSIKSDARGFRNFQNYRIAILFHCGKLNLYP
jgi:transposase